MKIDKRTKEGQLLLKDIEFNTSITQSRIEQKFRHLAEIISDIEVRERLENLSCKHCYYDRYSLAGQGFTSFTCKICKKNQHHPNTSVPELCNECAKDNGLCKYCMSKVQYDTTADRRIFNYNSFKN
jgi:hypothetical protein